jgi:hypothetical protein
MAARAPKGEVLRLKRAGGLTYALRFMAYGERQYVTLGRADEGWTERRAEDELQSTLAAVRANAWQPWQPTDAPQADPNFHEFASAWFAANSGQ